MASLKHTAGLCLLVFSVILQVNLSEHALPLVINTWAFTNATLRAHQSLTVGEFTALDALVEGCSVCEREQCDGTVGYGGSPDENGETTLDAMVMDGTTMNVGAVAALREIKHAIAVARHVLENTKHTMLVGDQATEFAVMMGFSRESLQTDRSKGMWQEWQNNHCQPNFWENVIPSPSTSCGPYEPISANSISHQLMMGSSNEIYSQQEMSDEPQFGRYNHDTIGMIVIDTASHVVAGTSTNGARNKIPGRVGDSPIPGAGAYADSSVGAAAATGDGDVMMRFMPSLLAVEGLRQGLSPQQAGEVALARITKHYPSFVGGIVVATKLGEYGAACHGIPEFPYSVAEGHGQEKKVVVKKVSCGGNRN
ncbi:putative N(4)-(beta-N-acetylglucosaminyl)-L-asparaginase GL17147 [Topomyia yanbarensis]|uniref:putative N(4)-(beta-N-acetylglucosaminyl)-L-asparaginase GL17147 n=1 Tax=Topomyia yanbarensis TaxID=2498891 RepID=UPI00273A9759|nr:putative N(4)-(beta-N-acetylglucosaminyl)-L-asparaginase GL17147 [Topomyia yanbarensis]